MPDRINLGSPLRVLLIVGLGSLSPLTALAQPEACPAPLAPSTVEAVCDVDAVKGDRVRSNETDCSWIYMQPGEETRSLTVLRTQGGTPTETEAMNLFAQMMGQGASVQHDLPDLGDGGHSQTQAIPSMGTVHTVTFSVDDTVVEVKASGTTDLRGGSASAPFCTLEQVEALAREMSLP